MKRVLPLYLLVFAFFAAISCKTMLTRGMYDDGLVYTAIANNYVHEDRGFWHPKFTETKDPDFYAHPPLMMYMLSIWMRMFGDGLAVAKGYSILVTILTAVLIVRLWRKLGFGRATGWLPLLMWTLIPPASHYAFFNMLEPTMLLFVLGAVLCALHQGPRDWLWHLLGGGLLFLSFMTKEFPGLFPLAFPLVLCLTGVRREKFGRAMLLTLCMAAGLLLPVAMLWATTPAAVEFFEHYYNIQILGQALGGGSFRATIVGRFFVHSGIIWGIVAVVLVVRVLRKRPDWYPPERNLRVAASMLALALCGVVPLMISAKQSDYFLVTAFPFIAIAAAALIESWTADFCEKLHGWWLLPVSVVAVAAALALDIAYCNRPGRDVVCQEDKEAILPYLQREETVTVPGEVFESYYDLKLCGYYYNNQRISLDSCHLHRHILTTRTVGVKGLADYREEEYRKIETPTSEFELYEKKD